MSEPLVSDSQLLSVRERIERARAVTASRAGQVGAPAQASAPVPVAAPVDMPHRQAQGAVRASQTQSLHDRVMPRRGEQRTEVLEILRDARRAGLRGLTRREIGERWEARDRAKGMPGRRDAALVARVVNELLKSQALKQLEGLRVCGVTGSSVTWVGLVDA